MSNVGEKKMRSEFKGKEVGGKIKKSIGTHSRGRNNMRSVWSFGMWYEGAIPRASFEK